MTFEEFIRRYDGKQVEVTGSPGARNQCVDLVNAYMRDVLNLPILKWVNAKDFPEKIGDKYEFEKNTLEAIPRNGDIIVWNGNVGGGYGHIGIFMEGNVNTFKSFDQNWNTPERTKIESHRYNNVRGWLRPKDDIIKTMDEYRVKAMDLFDEYRPKRKAGAEGNYESYARAIIASDKAHPGTQKQLAEANIKISGLETISSTQVEAMESMKKQINTLMAQIDDYAENPPIITTIDEPQFTNHVAQFFYKMAKFAQND